MFPPQRKLKVDLYNQIKAKLNQLGKKTREDPVILEPSKAAVSPGSRHVVPKVLEFTEVEKYYKIKPGPKQNIVCRTGFVS